MSSNFLPSLGKLSRYIAYNVLDICHSCRDAPVKKKGPVHERKLYVNLRRTIFIFTKGHF